MTSFVIVQDTREKQPLRFPDTLIGLNRITRKPTTFLLSVRKEKLLYGDYLLDKHPDRVIIERKKNLRELTGNCLNPHKRQNFVKELTRLRDNCAFPWLLLEGDICDLGQGPGDAQKNVLARDSFLDLIHQYRVSFMCMRSKTISQRYAVGRWVAATLISGVYQ